jgi:hypothetical protein
MEEGMYKAGTLLLAVLMCSFASAGTTGGGDLTPCRDKAVVIAPMTQNFDQYITAEIVAQKINLRVTINPDKAQCLMKGDVSLGRGLTGQLGSASVQMIGPDGDVVIWSATSGDKDSVKDLAHNIVKQLKHDLSNSSKVK